MTIPFNKPYSTNTEIPLIQEVLNSGQLSGNGKYTQLCHRFFEQKYGFNGVLLTTSCTAALEMCALLLNISVGDEVIVPSYTFVTSASAFVRQGATIVLADSDNETPNVDLNSIKKLITNKTKAIVIVHYAGVAVDMDQLLKLIEGTDIKIIEDAAHCTNSYYKNRPLGGIGHLGVFSFHQTKNITAGEGGLLIINDPQYIKNAEIIWEKGTNRRRFFDGEVDKYEWVDLGSSFLPSELNAALLWSQILALEEIQEKRIFIRNRYAELLQDIEEEGKISIPKTADFSTQNGHTFYLLTASLQERDDLISFLKLKGIDSAFHYTPLHLSLYYKRHFKSTQLPNAEKYGNCLLRLPLFTSMTNAQIDYVVQEVKTFYK